MMDTQAHLVTISQVKLAGKGGGLVVHPYMVITFVWSFGNLSAWMIIVVSWPELWLGG